MSISGNLSTIGLPDVLQLLSTGNKTGTLHVSRESDSAHVYFREGNIIYASSTTRKDALLDILVRSGALTLEDAEQIRVRARSGKRPIEKILKQGEYVTTEVLMDAAMVQAREIVYELFQWFDGEFRFTEGELPPGSAMDLTVSLAAFNLIMEGARRIDEWSRIRKVIPSMDTIFAMDDQPDTEQCRLSRDDLVILSMVDGKTPVRAICRRTGMSEFDLCRTLYGFKTAGLIRAVARAAPELCAATRKPFYKSRGILAAAAGIFAVILVATGFLLGGSGNHGKPEMANSGGAVIPASSPVRIADGSTPMPGKGEVPRHFDPGTPVTPAPVMTVPAESPVPATPTPPPTATSPPAAPPAETGGRIDINTASMEELESLPRVGPATARNIIAYREEHGPFRTPHDIVNVRRIGEKTFHNLEPLITCGKSSVSGGSTHTGSAAATRPKSRKAAVHSRKININTAGESELTKLPGIGPAKARAIITYRTQIGPFKTIHDITEIRGIGEKTFAKMQDMLTVQ